MRTKGLKVSRRRFCEKCRKPDCDERGHLIHEPIWALQYIGDNTPCFYKLGSHIRGFGLIRLCDQCADEIKREYSG